MTETSADPTQYSSHHPAQMAAELKVVVGRIARRLRQAHAAGELTLSEASVLSRLDRQGPASPGVLAEEEGVRPQAMAATLAALGQRGLVDRTPDPADGRRVVMSITAAGRALVSDRRSVSVQRIAHVLDDVFTPTERRKLLAVLPLLDRLAAHL
jgi:DNA-binding MarR family transcriptional regulator